VTARSSLARRAAERLMTLASSVLPDARRDWGAAMRAELDYAKSDAAALSWAFGCVLAGMKERVHTMMISNGRISRWVLIVEWLACFGPLTALWCFAVANAFGDDAPMVVLVTAAMAAIGPLALATSMLATLGGAQRRLRRVAQGLEVVFAIAAVLRLADVIADGGLRLQWFESDGSVFVLLALLPLTGSLHLVHILGCGQSNAAAV
jgi:hypothetical protein